MGETGSHTVHEGDENIYGCVRLGRKGVNFGNSLTAAGVCYMGSKDEDVVKYFGKKIVFTYAQLDSKCM